MPRQEHTNQIRVGPRYPKPAQLWQGMLTISDPIDEVLFDTRNDVFSTLAIYQMVPGPAIQGDRLLDAKAEATWSRTSIELRFGPGEVADQERIPLHKRIRRRLIEEGRALLGGTRYTFIPHG